MIGQMVSGLTMVFEPVTFMWLLISVVIGLIFGVIPGLNGLTLLAVLIPICNRFEPAVGLTLLMAGHAITYQGGAISAILLNVPGVGASACTLIDGFPMTEQGRAGEALGASQAASAMGGVFGAIILALLIPVVRPILMAVGASEIFFMIFMGLSFIAVLGSGSIRKGLISGGFGLMLAFVGSSGLTAESRFAFGSTYLLDGFKVIPLVLGLFAIPTVLDLIATGGTIAKVRREEVSQVSGVMKGVTETLRNWWLVLRCSAIGTIVGIIPGVGADAAVWIAYGHAKQTSKQSEMFGKGCIEGVIAPESANNAKEGGAILPTLAFGIPGSAAFAMVLGALMVMGIEPGPLFLTQHLDLAFMLVSVVVIANLIATGICLSLSRYLAKLVFIRGHLLAPPILIFIVIGAYASHGDLLDIVWTLVFGALGVFMKNYGYNGAATLLGFVLGGLAEKYFFISLKSYGPFFFLRPISLILLIVTVFALSIDWIRRMMQRRDRL